MSHGVMSPLYRPIDQKIIAETGKIYGQSTSHIAHQLEGCNIETLLFVSLVHQFTRAKEGDHYELLYSAILHNNSGKMQTPQMRLMHDVRVELMMAGRQYTRLVSFFQAHGLILCHKHSCGDALVPSHKADQWYEANEQDQLNRTMLDWCGTHTMVDCFGCLTKKCFVPKNLQSIYDQIFDATMLILSEARYETRLPTMEDFQIAA